MLLSRYFYSRPTLTVAQELLGKFLVRKIKNKIISGKIVETEAYVGQSDLACHAARGKTERNKVMFGKAGLAYVYFIYGMYYCLNIVTEKADFPAAVLIRALEPIQGIEVMVRNRKIEFFRHSERSEESSSKNNGILCYARNKSKKEALFNLTNGPGKLCQALQINRKINGKDLIKKDKLWVENSGLRVKKSSIVKAKRIGIEYAEKSKDNLWRFYIKNNPFVSHK